MPNPAPWLNRIPVSAHHLLSYISEVQDFATNWLWIYNHERPNMALGGITPKQKLAMVA
jgi:putative transposase